MWHDSGYGYAYPTISQSTPYPLQYSMPPPSIQPFPNLGAPPLWYMSLPPPPLVSESSSSSIDSLHDNAVSFPPPLPVYSDCNTPHPMYQMSASGSDNQSPVSSLSSDSQTMALRSSVAERLRCFMEQNPNHLYQIEFQGEQIPKFIITPIQLHVPSENQINSSLDTSNCQNMQSAEESSQQGDCTSSDPADTTSENEEFQGTTSISPQTPSDDSSLPPSSADNSDLSSKNSHVSPLPKQRIDKIQYIVNDFMKKNFSSDTQIAGYKMELPNKTEENNLAIRLILHDKDDKVTSLKMTLEAEEEIPDQFHENIHNESPHSVSTHADKSYGMKMNNDDLMCKRKRKPYVLRSYASLKTCPSRRSARLWINMCKKARDMLDEKDEEENLIYQTYVRNFHNEDIQYRRSQCNTKKYEESLQAEEKRNLSEIKKSPLSTNESALPADSTGTIKQNLQNRPGIFPETSINGGALNQNNRNNENLQVNMDNDRDSDISSADTVILDHFKLRSNIPMCIIHMFPNEAASNRRETIQDLSTPVTSPHNNQFSDEATANGLVTSTPDMSKPKPRTLPFEDANLNQYDWTRKSVTDKEK